MHARTDDNPMSGTIPADSSAISSAGSLPSTTSQPNRNAIQMELISAVMRRSVPSVGRRPEKLRNKAKCSNQVGLIVNGVGVSMVIVFSRESDRCRSLGRDPQTHADALGQGETTMCPMSRMSRARLGYVIL